MERIVTLSGGSPWGFRLVGGCDFRATLAISKVTPGGKADRAGLKAGDVISAINGKDTTELTHLEAQNQVKSSTRTLALTIGSVSRRSDPVPQPVSTVQAPSHSPKPPTQTATHTWQPKASKPPPSAPISAPLPPPPSNDDFLPPPPPSEVLQQAHVAPPKNDYRAPPKNDFHAPPKDDFRAPPKDDFPAPPVQVITQQANPNSNETIVCEGCKQTITNGSYLVAQGKYWHPEEFVCSAPNCGKSLKGTGFIEEKGKRYCSDCHAKNFGRRCGKCHQNIVGEIMHALNQTWHVTCFVCTACGQPFRDGVFQLEKDKPYCVEDFNKLFGSNCKACGQPITAGDQYVEAIKASWHDRCFTCAVCHIDLKNAGFFSVNERPVCGNHKNARLPA